MSEPPANPQTFIAQGLDFFSNSALQQIAKNLGLRPAPSGRDRLIVAISAIVGTPAHIVALEARLSPPARAMLATLPVRMGNVSLQHFMAVGNQEGIVGAELVDLVRDLLGHVCLIPVSPGNGSNRLSLNVGDYGFVGVLLRYDLTPGLEQWATQQRPSDRAIRPVEPPSEVLGSALTDLQRMLFAVTAELRRRPVRLTNAGTPNRTDLARLLKGIGTAGSPSPPGTRLDESPLLWLALATGAANGIIELTENRELRPSGGLADFPHLALFTSHDWVLIVYDEVHLLPAPRVPHHGGDPGAALARSDGDPGPGGRVRKRRVFPDWPKAIRPPWKLLEAIMGQYLDQLQRVADEFGAPLITGKTPNLERERLYARFRTGELRRLVVSRVGNFAIDLPSANVAIQISGTFGSRQEEAQRLGRVLRPKEDGGRAFFYSLVTRDTSDQQFAARRQLFLTEQGYRYTILDAATLLRAGLG